MPIYEFHCQKCGKDSELLVRSAQWEGTACPHCGSTRIAKKLSVFAAPASSESGCPDAAVCPVNTGGGCCCSGRGPHRH